MPRRKLRLLTSLSMVAWIGGACDCSGKGEAHVSSSGTSQSTSSSTTGTSSSTNASGSSSAGTGGGPTGTRVRLVEANLSSGNNQNYDPGEGIRILSGIHGDVLLLQEFNFGTNSDTDLLGLVHSVCGMNCSYVRGPAAQIPNGVITSYPVLSSGSWTDPFVANRTFVWVQIDVPGSKNLWAISVHLLTTNPTARANEAAAIMSNITASIPAGDYIVVGGDFNTDNRMEPALAAFDPLFMVGAPFPVDQNGNDNTSGPRTKPHDWVLANDALDARRIPTVIGSTTFTNGAVVDTRIYMPLADITPALMGDSGAVGMQHMAVVKDVALE